MTDNIVQRSLDCARDYAVKLAQEFQARSWRGDSAPTPLQHQYDYLTDIAVDWWPHAPAERVREVVHKAKQRHPVDGSLAPTKW